MKNKGWIKPADPYGWFRWYFRYWLGRGSLDDERNNRWKGIVSRLKGKLINKIKDDGGKFNDYWILHEITQILLHWCYELNEKVLLLTLQINV